MNPLITRRRFLRESGVAAAGLSLGPALLAQGTQPNEKLVLGLIGCGDMGRANMKNLLQTGQVNIAAVCDVDSTHLQNAVKDLTTAGKSAPKTYKDFRQLLEQKDINAVIIGTPDHWHAVPFIAACEAGKDIYCEKPISHSLVEAKAMLNAAKHFRRVVQIGTWQRSVKHFQEAIDFVRSGQMGNIAVCRAWFVTPLGGWLKPIGHQSPQNPPPELDWDFWLGPAPRRTYTPNRCHFNWRWFYDYAGALTTDWGAHMIDIVLLGMQQSDPIEVHAVGGNFVLDDDRDTPDTLQVIYKFPKWVMNWEVRFNNGRGLDGGTEHGSEFIGAKGILIADRGGNRFYPEGSQDEGTIPKREKPGTNHWQNFIDCVKSREKPRSDIESMAKTTMICHLGNIAYQSGKAVRWDAKTLDVANRADVQNCPAYSRPYRAPWKLKHYRA
jgi:predicted dehydrogenase